MTAEPVPLQPAPAPPDPTAAAEPFVRGLLQEVGIGLAVVDPDSWRVVFENARFFEWFPPDPELGEGLSSRMPALDAARASSRLEARGRFELEVEVGTGARTTSLDVRLRSVTLGERESILVECHDATKHRRAEAMLDSYSQMAERNARELQREKERVEKLLLNIMPRAVYEELKEYGVATPQRFETVTVLLLDFVGFTDMALSRDPSSTIAELNDIFSAFDRIVELFGGERVKTIGDAYLAVSGLPEASPDHAHNMARVALRMRRYLERRNAAHAEPWRSRIGLASGPVIGSIVGIQKYVYDIFGPAVNLAARMEGLAEPMQIVLSESAVAALGDGFSLTDLGEREVKGFGTMRLASLDGEQADRPSHALGL